MNFYAWTGLINAVTCFAAGLFVWSRHQKDPRHTTFVFFMLSVFTWAFFYFWWQLATDAHTALWLCRALVIGAFFAPVTHLHHVATLVDATELPWTRRLIRFGYASAVVLFLANPTPLVVREVAPRLFFPYWPLPGPLWHFYTMIYVSYCVYMVGLISRGLVHSSGATRNQFRYLLVGTLIAFAGASTNFLLWYDIPIPPVGSIVVPFYVIVVALAVIRFQFLDIRIVIRKSLVYSLLIACITAAYLVMVLILERGFQGFVGYRSIFATVVVAFLIALGFNPLRERLQTIVDRLLFKATPSELAAQREQLLVEVRKGDQMKAVATLAAGLAHEIKNPLTALKTFVSYLPEQGADPAFQRTFHRIAGQELERLDRIARYLLDLAKPTAHRRTVTLTTLVDETLELFSSECLRHHVEIKRSYHSQAAILADPNHLRQILLNLLMNGVDAMPQGGLLWVTIRQDGARLSLLIEDTGRGIAPEHVARIFEPFFTTKAEGHGLGLAIVRELVTDHGGTIAVQSHLHEGTRFTLSFPLAESTSEAEDKEPRVTLKDMSLPNAFDRR